MVTTTQPMTAEALLDMPADGFRYELIRGELRKMPPTGYAHGKYELSIGASLAAHVKANRLGDACGGDAGFLLGSNPDHVRAPDVAFVRRERVEALGEVSGFFPGAPDLAIEIISPNDRYSEVEEKVEDWLGAGTLAVIVVDPRRRSVKISRSLMDAVVLTEADTLAVEQVVPGWRMLVRDIFG